jgi:O-antigen biosynthesis protein
VTMDSGEAGNKASILENGEVDSRAVDAYTNIEQLKRENRWLEQELARTSALLEVTRAERDVVTRSLTWRWSTAIRLWLEKLSFIRSLFMSVHNRWTLRNKTVRTQKWLLENATIGVDDLKSLHLEASHLTTTPMISIILVVCRTPEPLLRSCLESIRKQVYRHWQLCVVDDASLTAETQAVLKEYGLMDQRVRLLSHEVEQGICGARNTAMGSVEGEFVVFVEPCDELSPHALLRVVQSLERFPEAGIIYSDEDRIDGDGRRFDPRCKGAWNPDLLLSQNYIQHLLVFRTDLVRKVGGIIPDREGVQSCCLYDLLLRGSAALRNDQVVHIPEILYHWRSFGSAEPLNQAPEATDRDVSGAIRAIQGHLDRCGVPALACPGKTSDTYRLRYVLADPPRVSIIIPTRNRLELLKQCVSGVLEKTDYPNLELLIVNNRSDDPQTLKYLEQISLYQGVEVIPYDAQFNFSAIVNVAAKAASGQVFLLLNNDVAIMHADWLAEMVGHAVRTEVGCVGAKLYYPDGRIQHAGGIVGVGNVAGHRYRSFPGDSLGYLNGLVCTQGVLAVTAACLAVRRNVFEQAGGFDERLRVAYNDVDFCLKVHALGYRNVFTPWAELIHHEGSSRGLEDTPAKQERFKEEMEYVLSRWSHVLFNDPYYNPNLTLTGEDYALTHPPRYRAPRILRHS